MAIYANRNIILKLGGSLARLAIKTNNDVSNIAEIADGVLIVSGSGTAEIADGVRYVRGDSTASIENGVLRVR